MKPKPSPAETKVLANFHRWINSRWRPGKAPFCSLAHPDEHGNLLIDHGKMLLELPNQSHGYRLTRLGPTPRLVARGAVLERVLLSALSQSITETFVATYAQAS